MRLDWWRIFENAFVGMAWFVIGFTVAHRRPDIDALPHPGWTVLALLLVAMVCGGKR